MLADLVNGFPEWGMASVFPEPESFVLVHQRADRIFGPTGIIPTLRFLADKHEARLGLPVSVARPQEERRRASLLHRFGKEIPVLKEEVAELLVHRGGVVW